MPNDYFQFKQFTVRQDKCAMKVCTDACILGSWLANKMKDQQSALDIGSGSGLLMLMLGQKSKAVIHGIEIDEPAFEQSLQNIQTFAGKERFTVFHGDTRHFVFPQTYDLIIVNPPFYYNDLQASSLNNNIAKHSVALDFGELLSAIGNNLSDSGSFGILLPFRRWEDFDKLATAEFVCKERLFVRQTPSHDYFRTIAYYGRKSDGDAKESGLSIRDDSGAYSTAFVNLLQDYYLYL